MSSGNIQFNPSTLKAAFDSGTNKLIMVAYEFGADCGCFLDATILEWSSVTTYSLGDYAHSGPCGGFTCISKVDNNLNHMLTATDWWTKVSEASPLGNASWNDFPPFGGFGKTPLTLRVTFSGISWGGDGGGGRGCDTYGSPPNVEQYLPDGWPQSGPNRIFLATQHPIASCRWTCTSPPSAAGGWSVYIDMCDDMTVYLRSLWAFPWSVGTYFPVTSYTHNQSIGFRCIQAHIASLSTVPPGIVNGGGVNWEDYWAATSCSECDDGWCGPDAFYYGSADECLLNTPINNQIDPNQFEGSGGTVTIIPGSFSVASWQNIHVYSLNDMVSGSSSGAYICIDGHTSSTDDRPTSGENWSDYWALMEGCL